MSRMSQNSRTVLVKFVTILGAIPLLMMGHDDGADPGNTGGPGETTCAQSTCHVGASNPTVGTGVTVDFGSQGASYAPGIAQTWTITVNGAQTEAYGFQVSAHKASDEKAQAGSFEAVDGTVAVICIDGTVKNATRACRADALLEYPTHTMPSRTGTWMLRWTPPADLTGDVKVYVAGNAVNFNGQPSGDRVFTNSFTLAAKPLEFKAPQTRSGQPLLQAFDNTGRLSGGTWIQIFGADFAPVTRPWGGGDFNGSQAPTSLDGVRVNVNGKPAYVSFISPTQVNAQTPTDDAVGPVEVEVINPAGSSKITMTKTMVSPAMLEHPLWVSGSTKYVVALFPDFTNFVGRAGLVSGVNTRPAKPGDTVIIYGVGCGAPGGEVIAGQRNITLPVQVRFGNTVAAAQSFFAPGAVGLCQYNVTVPNLGAGDVAVELTVDGVATGQNLSMTIQP